MNRQKGTLKVEVKVTNADARLLPDMSVRVNFLAAATATKPGEKILLAPRAALRRAEQESYVWIVDGGHVRRQPVTLGTELGDQVQITAGLAGTELLVVGDATSLVDGGPVAIATEKL